MTKWKLCRMEKRMGIRVWDKNRGERSYEEESRAMKAVEDDRWRRERHDERESGGVQ